MAERLTDEQIKSLVAQVDDQMMNLTIFRNGAMLGSESGVQRNIHRLGIVRTTLLAVLGEEDLNIALEPDEIYGVSDRVLKFRPDGVIEEPDTSEILLNENILYMME